jgi:RND family efflux transporter MFP subunit
MKKLFFILILTAGLGFLGWQVFEKATEAKKQPGGRRQRRNVPVAVEVTPAKQAAIREVGKYMGSLYPSSEFRVAPKIGGRLEKILVDIGDTVQGGQLVATLDAEEYRQQVGQAKAELEVARANLQERQNVRENAKRELDRTQALRKKKIASVSQLDSAESEYRNQTAKVRVARAQVAQREAAMRTAEVRLSYSQIQVPTHNSGGLRVVGERFVDEGAMLASNTPIVSLLDIDTLTAVIHVIERDYPKIGGGLTAMISTDAFPGKDFTGQVIRIAPLLREKSREARIEIEVPNKDRLLKPGMFVRVQIEFTQHDNATVVPAASLVKRDGAQGIFLADIQNKKAKFVPVTVGIANGKLVEILEPPVKGPVVTLGQHLLEDGSAIMLPGKPGRPGKSGKKGGKRPGMGKPGAAEKAEGSGVPRLRKAEPPAPKGKS